MKRVLLAIAVSVWALCANSQKVVKDASGNYVAVKVAKDSASGENTGKTFTTAKGEKFPIMQSKRGKLYIIRTSKTGNVYKQYLSIDGHFHNGKECRFEGLECPILLGKL